MFILVPILYYCLIEERGNKWDMVGSTGFSNLKIILTLLAKAVVIYMQVLIIEIEKPSFEGLFMKTKPMILF